MTSSSNEQIELSREELIEMGNRYLEAMLVAASMGKAAFAPVRVNGVLTIGVVVVAPDEEIQPNATQASRMVFIMNHKGLQHNPVIQRCNADGSPMETKQ